MLAKELINDSVPPVKTSDTSAHVLNWMGEFKVLHLPIVNHENLLGVVSESDLLELEELDTPVGTLDLMLPAAQTFVHESAHLYEVLKVMSTWKLDVVPVVAENETYLGLVTRADVIEAMAVRLGSREPGGIIVLEMAMNSYSLAEIGRICESNDAKVLSLTTHTPHDPGLLFVTLKLNIRELSRVISTFERFNYNIVLVVFDADQLDDVKANYENLLKYLSM